MAVHLLAVLRDERERAGNEIFKNILITQGVVGGKVLETLIQPGLLSAWGHLIQRKGLHVFGRRRQVLAGGVRS